MSSNPRSMGDEKDRLRSECDMLATQAGACAEEVDRIRVEIGAVQAENARLKSALADSERKRVEAEAALENWRAGMAELSRARKIFSKQPRYSPPPRPFGSTPTQETTHDEG